LLFAGWPEEVLTIIKWNELQPRIQELTKLAESNPKIEITSGECSVSTIIP
jgi:hypothetical protein